MGGDGDERASERAGENFCPRVAPQEPHFVPGDPSAVPIQCRRCLLDSLLGAERHGDRRDARKKLFKEELADARPRRSPCFLSFFLFFHLQRAQPLFRRPPLLLPPRIKNKKQNSTSWDEIIVLPGQFRDGGIGYFLFFKTFFFFLFLFFSFFSSGSKKQRAQNKINFFYHLQNQLRPGCELVVAAYNHNAILADDLIGSGGTDLRGLHGAAGAAGSHARRIQLFDKNDEPAGTLMLDVISVDKEVAGGAPAVGAPVAAGLGAAREGGGISPAAAPTTPGAQGEVRRTPSGPSSVEAERERLQRARETTTAATGEGAAASPEGEGVIEKIKRATGIGAQAAREPSPERRPALAAAAAPVSAAPISTPTRTVPAPRHRELEGEVGGVS